MVGRGSHSPFSGFFRVGFGVGVFRSFPIPGGICPALCFWLHNSAGGDSVSPDPVPSGDICLGGYHQGERMRCHGVCHVSS